ncbi:MAG TPA: HD domain-containing phosphohydrolase [Dehalococcoidia bacterium]|nr:HD domain-containing phosphohydrolase [Dehalococcoidia bacterium]
MRWKIVLPYAFLTLILAISGGYLVTRLVTGPLSERFDNQLAEAGQTTSDALVRKEREHLQVLRSVTFTTGVPEGVQARNGGAVEDLVKPLAANQGTERLELLDTNGQRLTAIALNSQQGFRYEDLADGDNPATWPLVQKVLARESDSLGDKFSQIVQTKEGFVLYTAGPVLSGDRFVGVALVGTTLNTFVAQARTQALADVTVYDFSGLPLASSFPQPDGTSAIEEANLSIGAEALAQALNGSGAPREHRDLWGRGYDQLYGRLEIRGQVVGLYSVALPTDFIFSAFGTTRWQMSLFLGVALAGVLAIGFTLAHILTQPILRLVRTARLVAAGDLTARSGLKAGDEIGVLASSFDEMTQRLQRQHLSTIRALTSAIDARDPYTMGHSVRVGQLAMTLGKQLGIDDKTLARIEVGGYLHDIGKIGIPDAILLKPGALDPEERLLIQEHPRIGLAILDAVDLPHEVIEFVQSHHERLDGSGYPHGLQGDEITLVAGIGAVADVYDAVTSFRPYRSPLSPEDALAMLRSQAGQLLNPDVVEALAKVLYEWEERRAAEPELRGFRLPELKVMV